MDTSEEKPNPEQPSAEIANLTISGIKLFAYGSAECDQFYIGEDKYEAKRPIDLTNYFTSLNRKVFMVTCGGLHTVVLTTNGEVYTLGCNDDGALGRQGDEQKPGKVELEFPVNMIAAGDSHSVACNSARGVVYHWGCYRNALKGNISKSQTPHRIGEEEFKNKGITKILSGANHTLVLADGKIFAWGDADAGILGRLPTSRRKFDQGLKIEGMGIKSAVDDIFTGAYHSFLKKKHHDKKTNTQITTIFAWGLNNWGQLGIGSRLNSHVPVEIIEFRGKDVVSIVGGEHHTIALLDDGNVYAFGKNDDGQLGLGEDYVPPKKEEPNGEVKGDMEEEKAEVKEEESNKNCVITPTKVGVEGVAKIYSGSNHNYLMTRDHKVYSWGMGDNYILGTREDDTEYQPKEIPLEFFKCKRVHQFGLAAQHIIYIGLDDENEVPILDSCVAHVNEVTKAVNKTPKTDKKAKDTKSHKKEDGDQEEEKVGESKDAKKSRNATPTRGDRSKSKKKEPVVAESPERKTSQKKGTKRKSSSDESHELKKVKKTPVKKSK